MGWEVGLLALPGAELCDKAMTSLPPSQGAGAEMLVFHVSGVSFLQVRGSGRLPAIV